MKKIGVFDSGFGGLDVLRGIVNLLPEYDYLYFGDSARAPYGPRPSEEVYEFATQAVDFLLQEQCGLIVFACNTASSDALHKIQHEYVPAHAREGKVIGVLIPLSEEAAHVTKNGRIGILATEGTVRSGAFVRELHKIAPSLEIFQQPCPLLVPLVEAGEHASPAMDAALRAYIEPLARHRVDTLILGCTHYGILEHKIRSIVGPDIAIVSGMRVVAERLKTYLVRHPEIERELGKGGIRRFCTTDKTGRFGNVGEVFFGAPLEAEAVELNAARDTLAP